MNAATTTPYGQATSATSLVIVPSSVGAANVVDYDAVDPDGAAQSLAINQQNKVALLSFQAAASTFYSVQLDALTLTPSGGSINYAVYDPSGASFVSGVVSPTARSIHLPQITTAGRYLVAFNSGSKTSVQITARVELNTALTTSGTTVPSSTTGVYQSKRFTFSATAGADLGLALTNLVLTPNSPNYVNVYVAAPNGQWIVNGGYCPITTLPGCSFNLLNLPQTGVYRVTVESQGQSTMSFDLTLSPDVTGALTFGTPLAVTLDSPGEQAWLTFTATAGQNVVLTKSSVATTPSGKAISTLVYNPAGSLVANTTNNTINLNNLSAGTYQVLISPADAATATLQVGVQ